MVKSNNPKGQPRATKLRDISQQAMKKEQNKKQQRGLPTRSELISLISGAQRRQSRNQTSEVPNGEPNMIRMRTMKTNKETEGVVNLEDNDEPPSSEDEKRPEDDRKRRPKSRSQLPTVYKEVRKEMAER